MRSVAAAIVAGVLSLAVAAQDLTGLPAPLVARASAARQACESIENALDGLVWFAVLAAMGIANAMLVYACVSARRRRC